MAGTDNSTIHNFYTQLRSSPCTTNSPSNLIHGFQKCSISTTTPRSVVGWVQDKLSARSTEKQEAKIVDQIEKMAKSDKCTLKMYKDDVDSSLSSWESKIMSGVGGNDQIKMAKEAQGAINMLIEQLGEDVTAEDLTKLDRKTKLKLAIACKKPLSELDGVFQQFRQMDVMHRIIRHRQANGIALPKDLEGLKMAMQTEAIKVMTKEEKAEMRDLYAKSMGMGGLKGGLKR